MPLLGQFRGTIEAREDPHTSRCQDLVPQAGSNIVAEVLAASLGRAQQSSTFRFQCAMSQIPNAQPSPMLVADSQETDLDHIFGSSTPPAPKRRLAGSSSPSPGAAVVQPNADDAQLPPEAPAPRRYVDSTVATALLQFQDSTAANTSEAMSQFMADISTSMDRARDKLQRLQEENLASSQATLRAESAEQFSLVHTRMDASDVRVATLSDAVSRQDEAIAAANRVAGEARARLQTLEQELLVLRAPQAPTISLDAGDYIRERNTSILRVRTEAEVPLAAIQAAIQPLLVAAQVAIDECEVQGDPLARQFTIAFHGAPVLASRKAAKTQRAQRNSDGTWRRMQAELPAVPGQAAAFTNMYIDMDKSRQDIFLERCTKRLRDLCAQASPAGNKIVAKRQDHILYHNWVPLATIESPAPFQTIVRWNPVNQLTAQLRTAQVAEQLAQAMGNPVDNVSWI